MIFPSGFENKKSFPLEKKNFFFFFLFLLKKKTGCSKKKKKKKKMPRSVNLSAYITKHPKKRKLNGAEAPSAPEREEEQEQEDGENGVTMASSSSNFATSAIPDWTVAEVRKALALMRGKWKENDERCINPSAELYKGVSMEQFSLEFLMGQHLKRHRKNRGGSAASARK
jgi:hypothetical protein